VRGCVCLCTCLNMRISGYVCNACTCVVCVVLFMCVQCMCALACKCIYVCAVCVYVCDLRIGFAKCFCLGKTRIACPESYCVGCTSSKSWSVAHKSKVYTACHWSQSFYYSLAVSLAPSRGFCDKQLEESSNVRNKHLDIFPHVLSLCLGTRLQAHFRLV